MEFLDFIKTQNESLYQVIFMRLHSEDVRLISSLASLYLASSGTGILPEPNEISTTQHVKTCHIEQNSNEKCSQLCCEAHCFHCTEYY